MYCPSCDKTYGAIHSRCPECHSWLKVSAPSGSRAKSTKANVAAKAPVPATPPSGGVSTLPRENDSAVSWVDSAPEANQWGSEPENDWGAAPQKAVAQTALSSPAPASGWKSGGGGWDDKDSSSSWGGAASPAPAPAKSEGSGWLNGGEEEDSWGASTPASSAATKASPVKPMGGGGSGWLGDSDSPASSPNPTPSPAAPQGNSSSWLNGGHEEPATPGRGWLGDGPAETKSEGNGWLNGESADTPSMTEMVDRAINVEDDDEFVDDSWVDEEIRDNEFDELEVPDYVPPTPEVGGTFLKMALVAVLVILVGGGVLFLRSDSITPEEKAAQEATKKLEFAQATIEGGKADLAAGKADLAVPQFQEAMVALSDVNAPQEKIYETEVLLCRSLMAAQEYREAYTHWKSLKASGVEKHIGEAKKGIASSSRELRIEANEALAEGKKYAAKNEVNSVKRLGRDALDIYKEYGGSRAQIGKAHGIIGRGFFNGLEYGSAQDHFKKAVSLAPGLGYEKLLADTNAQLRPSAYIQPLRTSSRRTNTKRRPKRDVSIGTGAGYQKASGRKSGRSRKRSASSGRGTSVPAAKAPRKMKEVPIYRSNKRQASSSKRKGQSGVLNTY